jgi:hypothetical protein
MPVPASVKPITPTINNSSSQADQLIYCYPFYEGIGTVLHDLVDNKDGTLVNFVPEDWNIDPDLGISLLGHYIPQTGVTVPYLDISGNTNFTVNVWIRISTSNASAACDIVNESNVGSTGYFVCGYQASTYKSHFQFNDGQGNSINLIGNTNLLDNTWHLLSYVKDGANLTVYIDGVLDVTGTATFLTTDFNTTSLMQFIYTDGNAYEPVQDLVGEIRVYSKAMTDSDLLAIFADPWNLYTLPEPVAINILKFETTEINGVVGETTTATGCVVPVDLLSGVPIDPPPENRGFGIRLVGSTVTFYIWDPVNSVWVPK